MAQKNKGKVVQMLSPENYIRKKARTLPIHECLVNHEWKNEGFANIIVARSHTNGNITACFYLVDLFCLGVKDTHYFFNDTRSNYQEKFGGDDEMSFKPISYTLAHNIIYASLEFAEEYGFKPHKDFTSTTRFMLEEDTEDVELIEVECGKDGKPFYVSGPYDDQIKMNKILAQLERTAGPGNFDYLLGQDDWDEEVEEDEFKGLSFEEKKKLFAELESMKKKPNEEEASRFFKLTNSIYKDLTRDELVDKYYDEYCEDLDIELTEDEIPDEMLGIAPGSVQISDSTRSLFMEIYDLAHEKPKKASKLLEEFRKTNTDIPAFYFLELSILQENKSKKYTQKLNEYAAKFPDYPLIRLLWMENKISTKTAQEEYLINSYDRKFFFPERTSLHVQEMFNYVMFKIIVTTIQNDTSRLEALHLALDVLDVQEDRIIAFDSLVLIAKMQLLSIHLNQ